MPYEFLYPRSLIVLVQDGVRLPVEALDQLDVGLKVQGKSIAGIKGIKFQVPPLPYHLGPMLLNFLRS
jgi:hypothetical protein